MVRNKVYTLANSVSKCSIEATGEDSIKTETSNTESDDGNESISNEDKVSSNKKQDSGEKLSTHSSLKGNTQTTGKELNRMEISSAMSDDGNGSMSEVDKISNKKGEKLSAYSS